MEMQNSNTSQLVFNINQCIAWASKFCSLKPGDLLLTGTPPGVGVFRNPPVFLKVNCFEINYFKRELKSKPMRVF